jgi:hypothetical protein
MRMVPPLRMGDHGGVRVAFALIVGAVGCAVPTAVLAGCNSSPAKCDPQGANRQCVSDRDCPTGNYCTGGNPGIRYCVCLPSMCESCPAARCSDGLTCIDGTCLQPCLLESDCPRPTRCSVSRPAPDLQKYCSCDGG